MEQIDSILKRLKEVDGNLDALSMEDRLLLLHLVTRWCSEEDVPGSVYGQG